MLTVAVCVQAVIKAGHAWSICEQLLSQAAASLNRMYLLALCRRLVYVRAAGPLTVTILSIAISNIFHLYNAPYNIRTVGTVPAVSFLKIS